MPVRETVPDGASCWIDEDSPYGRFASLADPMGARFKVMTPSE